MSLAAYLKGVIIIASIIEIILSSIFIKRLQSYHNIRNEITIWAGHPVALSAVVLILIFYLVQIFYPPKNEKFFKLLKFLTYGLAMTILCIKAVLADRSNNLLEGSFPVVCSGGVSSDCNVLFMDILIGCFVALVIPLELYAGKPVYLSLPDSYGNQYL
jgi:hypothetical protein